MIMMMTTISTLEYVEYNVHKNIKKDGVHVFEPECIIDLQNNHENVVKKEQLGIYITGNHKDIKNVSYGKH